jgi:hypothetical protein
MEAPRKHGNGTTVVQIKFVVQDDTTSKLAKSFKSSLSVSQPTNLSRYDLSAEYVISYCSDNE